MPSASALAARGFPVREVVPSATRTWLCSRQDEAAKLEGSFAELLNGLQNFDSIAKERLYENSNPLPMDFRCHRGGLASFIGDAQQLIIKAGLLREDGVVEATFFQTEEDLLEQHITKLLKRLHEWHGALEEQTDIPQSFKDGIKDIAGGKVVDMEKALKEEPH